MRVLSSGFLLLLSCSLFERDILLTSTNEAGYVFSCVSSSVCLSAGLAVKQDLFYGSGDPQGQLKCRPRPRNAYNELVRNDQSNDAVAQFASWDMTEIGRCMITRTTRKWTAADVE